MKIDRIRLKNFALIKTGMGLDELDIDFTKAKHVVTLIIGNNGTGKTAMLSNFHPFAYLGGLENREDSDLIIPDKDGHKQIWYSNGKDKYEIEHIYLKPVGSRTSRSVKSYIRKNGVELNEPGTVTSFNEIVEQEFQIEQNFLKLIRLGPNVQNFIRLSVTERKSFISKLLAEVDVYMRDYKYANNQSKFLNNALKIAVSKLDKLHVTDISVLDTMIERKEANIERKQQELQELDRKFYEFKGSINIDEINRMEAEYEDIEDDIRTKKHELSSLSKPKYIHITTDTDTLATYQSQLDTLNERRAKIVSERAVLLSKRDDVQFKLDEANSALETAREDQRKTDMKEYLKELSDKITQFTKSFDINKFDTSVTKSDFESYTNTIGNCIAKIRGILELPERGLKSFRSIIMDDMITEKDYPSVINEMKSQLVKLYTDLEKAEKLRQQGKVSGTKDGLSVPADCDIFNTCPYYLSYQMDLQSSSKSSITSIEEEIEEKNTVLDIFSRLSEIKNILQLITLERRLDTGYDGIIKAILTNNPTAFVKPDVIQDQLEFIEYYEEYTKNIEKRNQFSQELQIMELSSGAEDVDSLLAKASAATLTISEYNKAISRLDMDETEVNEEIRQMNDIISDFTQYIQYTAQSTSISTEIDLLKEKLKGYDEVLKRKAKYDDVSKQYERDKQIIQYDIKTLDDALYEDKVKRTQFIELNDEIESVQERYALIELLKEAVSTTKGIPLIYINSYFKSLRLTANEIIKHIYDSELILDEFVVNDKEFRIPYRTKGTEVRDIKYASQAESSVATLAISFAMLEQFAYNYNIILLDEVDGPMYKHNKERFFAALEGMLERIKCEQSFIITQSTMFNDYPVNLIITDPTYKEEYGSSNNVIFQR